VYTTKNYNEAHEQEFQVIYQSAATIRELAINTDIPFAKEAYEAIGGDETWEGIFSGMPELVEMRFLASEKLISQLIQSGEASQAVELASGLTPHAASLSKRNPDLKKYIETDFRVNLLRKKELNKKLNVDIDLRYVAGNLFEKETWENIEKNLDPGKVLIFSEGFMLYMSSEDDRTKLAENFKGILESHGGYFIFDDSLRYHPEFLIDPDVKDFLGKLIKGETVEQDELTKEWEERGFVVERIPEDSELSCENKFPDKKNEIALLKKHFKLWKLSLKE
jgi:hypothetical protein